MLSLLMYTPIAMYIPIKNPELEQRYGRQILETQQRLNQLAQDVLILRDYNNQLRKALGEFDGRDSVGARRSSSKTPQRSVEAIQIEDTLGPQHGAAVTSEAYGDYDMIGDEGVGSHMQVGFRGGLPLLPPADGVITQEFDPSHGHFGIDYAVKRGTAVHAATDGFVVFADWTYEDGNMIILSHGGGYLTLYKHNQLLLKNPHSFVKRGEVIAESGATGQTSFGPHVHFEVWKNGLPQDPQEYLLISPRIQ
jgi:murein DD-endopeptidase MepM/ murein hydrolase activator NlpD